MSLFEGLIFDIIFLILKIKKYFVWSGMTTGTLIVPRRRGVDMMAQLVWNLTVPSSPTGRRYSLTLIQGEYLPKIWFFFPPLFPKLIFFSPGRVVILSFLVNFPPFPRWLELFLNKPPLFFLQPCNNSYFAPPPPLRGQIEK